LKGTNSSIVIKPDTTFFDYFRSYNAPAAAIAPAGAPVGPAGDTLGDSTVLHVAPDDAGGSAPAVAPVATE
jgi:hypothetical protein